MVPSFSVDFHKFVLLGGLRLSENYNGGSVILADFKLYRVCKYRFTLQNVRPEHLLTCTRSRYMSNTVAIDPAKQMLCK